jgi:hypothetical protein
MQDLVVVQVVLRSKQNVTRYSQPWSQPATTNYHALRDFNGDAQARLDVFDALAMNQLVQVPSAQVLGHNAQIARLGARADELHQKGEAQFGAQRDLLVEVVDLALPHVLELRTTV